MTVKIILVFCGILGLGLAFSLDIENGVEVPEVAKGNRLNDKIDVSAGSASVNGAYGWGNGNGNHHGSGNGNYHGGGWGNGGAWGHGGGWGGGVGNGGGWAGLGGGIGGGWEGGWGR